MNLLRDNWPEEYDAVRQVMREQREAAYRRALEHAGYMPGSVEIAVERDREWITKGRDK